MCQSEHTKFFAALTECAAELSERSLPKQCSRNSIHFPSFNEENSGKKKAHKHKLFGPVALGTPANVPGTNRVCPRDKPRFVPGTNPGLSQGQTQVFSLLYTVEAQFVPGTNLVCPGDIPGTKGGRKSLCVKSLCAFPEGQRLTN